MKTIFTILSMFFQLKNLQPKIQGVLFINFLLISSALLAQTKLISFEPNEDTWTTKHPVTWQQTNDRASEGTHSIKYFSDTAPDLSSVFSMDTEHTIYKVRVAKTTEYSYVVGGSYNGTIVGVNYDGVALWKNELSGYMIHDMWVADLDNDGNDEILIANADGTIYCLSSKGELKWEFKQNDVPMISVCTIRKTNGDKYIACGGSDLNMYYVDITGGLINTIPSSSYDSKIKSSVKWHNYDGSLPSNVHTVNFLRPVPQPDGSDDLVFNGIVAQSNKDSMMFHFKPEALTPYKSVNTGYGYAPVGDLEAFDPDGDGVYELVIGVSGIRSETTMATYAIETGTLEKFEATAFNKPQGYRVAQTVLIEDEGVKKYLVFMGQDIFLVPLSLEIDETERITGVYSYYDIEKDNENNKLILASSQSGGSGIHVIDLSDSNWKNDLKNLAPPGNIQAILNNTTTLQSNLDNFIKPSYEREPIPVYLMSPPNQPSGLISEIKANYNSPIFMGYSWLTDVGNWDRSVIGNSTFENAIDSRKTYNWTVQQVKDKLISGYGENGLATWGGHGVDPYYYGVETIKDVIDAGNGKKSIWVWPEMTILFKDQYGFLTDNLLYPLAEYSKTRNAKQVLRTKHLFWQSIVYKPEWSRLISGEFADVFVPGMEETQDQTMELSLASRLGLWASGSVNSWSSRVVRDNASFMRTRQFSNQNLPNHFLRNSVFHLAYGAEYINNFNITSEYSEYMSVLWELIAKGALYVPKKSEILSFNPVHISIADPDSKYLREGNSSSTTLQYDGNPDESNPFVFGRLPSTWSGAAVTDWDFSRYAAGVKDRRLNFLAPYPNGMVLITPPQEGTYADATAPRGKLTDHLHPIYKNITKEFITNGRQYLSSNGSQTFSANTYASTVKSDIEQGAALLPVNVSGEEIAWVVAQTSPTHLRLTLIDGGYLNPSDKVAKVKFNTVTPVKVVDVMDGKEFTVTNASTEIDIPLGLFRFIDIELSSPLN